MSFMSFSFAIGALFAVNSFCLIAVIVLLVIKTEPDIEYRNLRLALLFLRAGTGALFAAFVLGVLWLFKN